MLIYFYYHDGCHRYVILNLILNNMLLFCLVLLLLVAKFCSVLLDMLSVDSATVMEIDHDVQHVYTETMRVLPDPADVAMLMPSQEAIAAKLTSPVITTFIDTDNIAFER